MRNIGATQPAPSYRGLSSPIRWMSLFMMCCLALAWIVPSAAAHAELVRSTPASGERLQDGPASVELLFSERLDPGGSRLAVLNAASRDVADGAPERFQEGKGLRVALPALGEGHYTVSYSVISADGHPISGAFVFTVGDPAPLPDGSDLDPHAQVGHEHTVSQTKDREFLVYTTRIAYFAGLLITAGLVLWSLLRNAVPAVRDTRERLLGFAVKFLFLAVLAYVSISLMDLAQDEPISEWGRILQETTIGRLYDAELLLALAALLLPRIGVAARLVWAILMLAAEAWSGHAAAFGPKAYTVGLDFAHLAAASVWSGGLVLLLGVWFREKTEAGRFGLLFSNWALWSYLVLVVSGVLSTLAFLPSLSYMQYTLWGKWLVAKVAVTVLIAAAALLIRRRLRRGRLPGGGWLELDVGLLAAIVLIVGVLTYQTPLPPNEPLRYHQMGTDMHVTLRIYPKAPGDNDFTLKIWLPEQDGAPKQVRLRMVPLNRTGMGPVDVPLQPYEDTEIDSFPNYGKFTYAAKGPYLPYAGEWKAEVLVTDAKGEELAKETTFRLY